MVQPLAMDLLQGYSPDAKLSIFDDTLPRIDVSPAGVLAKGETKYLPYKLCVSPGPSLFIVPVLRNKQLLWMSLSWSIC